MIVVLSACAKKGGITEGDAGDFGDTQTTQDMGIFVQTGEIGARIEEYIVPAPDKRLEELEEKAGGGYMMRHPRYTGTGQTKKGILSLWGWFC